MHHCVWCMDVHRGERSFVAESLSMHARCRWRGRTYSRPAGVELFLRVRRSTWNVYRYERSRRGTREGLVVTASTVATEKESYVKIGAPTPPPPLKKRGGLSF